MRYETSLASSETLRLFHRIAGDIGLRNDPPIRIQYSQGDNNEWMDLVFVDQLHVIAKVCKIYRTKRSDASDQVMVNHHSQTLRLGYDGTMLSISLTTPFHPEEVWNTRVVLHDETVLPGIRFENFIVAGPL